MTFDINEKINEYLFYLKRCGYVNDFNKLLEISRKLHTLKVKIIHNCPGDALLQGNTLSICLRNCQKNMKLKGNYYFDEVIFHEFSHYINSFNNSIYGKDSFIINDYIENYMDSFTTGELIIQSNPLLYNQDPSFGIALLNEFIAQDIAQNLVLYKLKNNNDKYNNEYAFGGYIDEYEVRRFTTTICEPPKEIYTSLADYEVFYPYAVDFINKYCDKPYDFTKLSINNNNYVKEFISNIKKDQIIEFYEDLCYLGVIFSREYIARGFYQVDDLFDPANNPEEVYEIMNKLESRLRTR